MSAESVFDDIESGALGTLAVADEWGPVVAVLGKWFTAELTIVNPTVIRPDRTSIEVSGTLGTQGAGSLNWPSGGEVVVDLRVVAATSTSAERIDGTVILRAPNGWTFAQGMADLPLSTALRPMSDLAPKPVLDSLAPSRVWLVATTTAVDLPFQVDDTTTSTVHLEAGMNWVVRCHPENLTGGIVAEAPGLTMSGRMVAEGAQNGQTLPSGQLPWDVADLPGVHLRCDLASDVAIGSLRVGASVGVYTPLSQAWLTRNPDCRPVVAVFGDLAIPKARITARLAAERSIAPDRRLEFSASFTGAQHLGVNVDDLAELFSTDDQTGFLAAHLPGPLAQAINSVTLRGLNVTVDTDAAGKPHVTTAGLYLGLDIGKVDLVTDVLAFDAIEGVEISVRQPFSSTTPLADRVSGVVIARAEFLEADVLAIVRVPDFSIDLHLVGDAKIPIAKLFAKHGTDASLQPAALVIEDFSVSADMDKNFAIEAKVAGSPPWSVQLGDTPVTLVDVTASAHRYSWGDKEFSFAATLGFGEPDTSDGAPPIELDLAATLRSSTTPGTPAHWHFTGGLLPDEHVSVRDIAAHLGHHVGGIDVPKSVADLEVEQFRIDFDSVGRDVQVAMAVRFPLGGAENLVRLGIDVKQRSGGSGFDSSFTVTINGLTFQLRDEAGRTVATFDGTDGGANPKGVALKPLALVESITHQSNQGLADSLELAIIDAVFVHQKPVAAPTGGGVGRPGRFLFGIGLGAHFDLTALPLVGNLFGPEVFSIDQLNFAVASDDFTKDDVTALRAAVPPVVAAGLAAAVADDGTLAKGPSINGRIRWDGGSREISIAPHAHNAPTTSAPATSTSAVQPGPGSPPVAGTPPAPSGQMVTAGATAPGVAGAGVASRAVVRARPPDGATWFAVDRSFGPIHIGRVGVRYEQGILWALLDASLTLGPLELALDGLAAGSSLTTFDPHFDLRGMSLDFSQGGVEIGAAFLRRPGTGGHADQYAGEATIRTPAFSLSALGLYSSEQGQASLFIYATMNSPLGGPAFFFVTGLAAGFGYNRRLVMPPIDQVETFALVSEVVHPPGVPRNLEQMLDALTDAVQVDLGEMFLCAGIRFSTFELVDTFVLVAVQFGHRFEIDVLGISTLILPPAIPGSAPVAPLAVIRLALSATFVPEEGFLGIQAQLTPDSFLFSRACHLTGGFAFFTWFTANPAKKIPAGDFVISLGGYHPAYTKPKHYPDVPRIGFNWKVSDQLTVKGGMYCALTPNAVMAGGSLQANWDSGSLKAWFLIGADFLIAWKPYHYDIKVYIDIGVSYTFELAGTHTITLDLSADLHIWGPDFSGVAELHILTFSVSVHFGSTTKPTPDPIDWEGFSAGFLPAASQVLSVVVAAGLVSNPSKTPNDPSAPLPANGDLGVVNPKDLVLAVNSAIPSTSLAWSGRTTSVVGTHALHIAPMDIAHPGLDSVTTITITSGDSSGASAAVHFEVTPIRKSVPAALWGDTFLPELASKSLIDDVVMGFEIRPANPPKPGRTHPIDRSVMRFETHPAFANLGLSRGPAPLPALVTIDRDVLDTTINDELTAGFRRAQLAAWGFDADRDVDLRPGYSSSFLGQIRMVGNAG